MRQSSEHKLFAGCRPAVIHIKIFSYIIYGQASETQDAGITRKCFTGSPLCNLLLIFKMFY